jgi:RimJ/RimL family protein N-acetyltransferase
MENTKQAKSKIKSFIDRKVDEWAIALKTENGNKIIGSIGIWKHAKSWKDYSKYNLSFNLVYLLAEEYWGMGICTEAAQKLMHFAFVGIKCDALGACHLNWNNRSRRVIEKCGFNKINKNYDMNDPNTGINYCLAREDYLKSHDISHDCSEYGTIDVAKYEPKQQKEKLPQKYDLRQPKQVKGSPYSIDNPVRRIDGISYIKEPTGYLCGQSCVAMLANVSVDEVIKIMGTDKGTGHTHIRKALNYYGIRYAPINYSPDPNASLPELCMIVFELPEYRHWSLYYKGVFYDPEFGIIYEYPPNALLINVWEIFS